MKTKEEIEELAEQYIEDNTGDHYVYCGFVDGYTQCQEDMVDVIDSLKKQLIMFQSKKPKCAVEGDYCAVCGSTEFWNNDDEEE